MAKGKHAAQAARRKYEAMLEVADRLNERNGELHARTKATERDAARVPYLLERISELEAIVNGDAKTRLEQQLDELRTEHQHQLDRICRALLDDGDVQWGPTGIREFLDVVGVDRMYEIFVVGGGDASRENRRNMVRNLGVRNRQVVEQAMISALRERSNYVRDKDNFRRFLRHANLRVADAIDEATG